MREYQAGRLRRDAAEMIRAAEVMFDLDQQDDGLWWRQSGLKLMEAASGLAYPHQNLQRACTVDLLSPAALSF